MANISVIKNDLTIYQAFLSLANAAPGKTNFEYHQDYMFRWTVAGYMEALNEVFEGVSDKAMGDLMIANLGLGAFISSEIAEQYLAANADDRVQAVLNVAKLLSSYNGTDALVLAAQTSYNNKIGFATSWSADNDSMSNFPGSFGGSTFMLTTGIDNLIGSAGVDEFVAKVVQNVNGEQTNQLATGDSLEGGAGIDSLFATVQGASALNFFPTSGIALETVGVEHASFTALSIENNGVAGAIGVPVEYATDETVVINAKNMVDLDLVASVQSDASLLIQNLTTLQSDDLSTVVDESLYANRRNTSEMTVRMDHSGNDAAVDQESNMTVLFDNDYLLSGQTSNSVIEIRAVNVLSLADDGQPLMNVTAVQFMVGAQSVVVTVTEAIQSTVGTAAAYSALVDAIENRLDELGITTVTVTALPARSVYFSDDVNNYDAQDLAGSYSPILLQASDDSLKEGLVNIDQTAGDFNGFYTQSDDVASAETLIEVQVELNKVGRGGEGGELVIGGMATDLANEWDFSANALEEGVERFNVTVQGDNTQYSSLSGLHSTNNTLQEVIVDWETGSLADLIIGNHNTEAGNEFEFADDNFADDSIRNLSSDQNAALKDVRLFDAANNNASVTDNVTITTDVTLSASITDESIEKYLDLTDTQADPADEDVHFEYNFGAGNDSLNLNISSNMLDAAQLNNRSDFDLSIDGGAGNDTVVVQIGNGDATTTTAWYANNNIEMNLSIDTGDGKDTIRANAGGSWVIEAGSGNDAIYSDNSGQLLGVYNTGRAVWVLNNDQAVAGSENVDTLVSNAHSTTTTARANVSLTFNYFGITSTAVEVGTTHETLGGVVTDLVINQAIKDAINNDNELSKLLIAEDAASGVLIVRSLTDGDIGTYVPTYVLTSVAPTQSQLDNGVVNWTAAGSQTALTFEIATDNAADTLDGVDSVVATASDIDAEAGNDVVVLSTSGLDTEVVNVADTFADLVFNATNAKITVDVFDRVVTSNYVTVTNGAGLVTVNDLTVTGSAGNDTIVATNGEDNILVGGAGNDTITGGTGSDTITGGAGVDIISSGTDLDGAVPGTDNIVIIGNTDSGITLATADVWTDFIDSMDTFAMGSAGDATALTGNYVEAAAAVLNFDAALIAANAALATLAGTSAATELYAFEFDATNGYVFDDIDGDGDADQVVVLTGVVNTEISEANFV